jgi:hypothetical protein
MITTIIVIIVVIQISVGWNNSIFKADVVNRRLVFSGVVLEDASQKSRYKEKAADPKGVRRGGGINPFLDKLNTVE